MDSSPLELNDVEDVSVAGEGTGGANRAEEAEADEGVARGAPVRRVDHPPEVIEISTDEENDPGEDKDVDEEEKEEEEEEEEEEEDASDEDEDGEGGLCHPGYLEWDNNDSWADWDEDCHGKMDTNAHRREYPEGFVWTCCGEQGGESDGCEPGDLGDVDEMYPDSPKFSGADGKEKGDLYHSGDLDWEYNSTWDDWDERCHGEMDTNTHREEYPEGFVWSCCGERGGESDGCDTY